MVKKDFSEQAQKLTLYDHFIGGPLTMILCTIVFCMLLVVLAVLATAICKVLTSLHYWHINKFIERITEYDLDISHNSPVLHLISLFFNFSLFVVFPFCFITVVRLFTGDLTMGPKRMWKLWKSGEFWNLKFSQDIEFMLAFIPYFGNYFFKSYCKVCTTKGTWNEGQICEHCKYK
jgi:hypothetical protein